MNPVDTVLHQSFPSVMVPAREPVAPMGAAGERLLVAGDGVYLEILRPWIRAVRRIARFEGRMAIPYGRVIEATELLCGPVDPCLIAAFYRMAHAAVPDETGAWIVWDAVTGLFRLVPLPSLSSGPGHLVYERPALREGEHVVVDCHSHGTGAAFFSRTDDQDDRHDVKFAFVLGHCDQRPSSVLRICLKGRFERMDNLPQAWTEALAAEVNP